MVNAVPHRKRFAPAKRRRHVPQPVDGGGAVDVVAEKTKGRAADLRRWHGSAGLREIASALWSPSYAGIFEDEFSFNFAECGGGGYSLPPTTYRARILHTNG